MKDDLNSPKIPSGKLPRILKMPTNSPLAQAAIDIALGDEPEGHALKVAKCKIEELSHTVRAIDARCKGHLAEIDELTEIIENLQLQIGQHEATIEGMRKELDGKKAEESPAKFVFKVGTVAKGPDGNEYTVNRLGTGLYTLVNVSKAAEAEVKPPAKFAGSIGEVMVRLSKLKDEAKKKLDDRLAQLRREQDATKSEYWVGPDGLQYRWSYARLLAHADYLKAISDAEQGR